MDKTSLEKLNDKKLFTIEGNIGAGKSTIIKYIIKDFPEAILVEEPVGEWQNIHGHNILEKKYAHPERWCYTFESYVLISKMNALVKAAESDKKIILIERCMLSDKVFFDVAVKLGQCNAMEKEMFNNLYDFLYQNVYPRLAGIIYLHTSVDECVNRIIKRNRSEESNVDKEYLKQLDQDTIEIVERANIPTLHLDGHYDLEKETEDIKKKLREFINKRVTEIDGKTEGEKNDS